MSEDIPTDPTRDESTLLTRLNIVPLLDNFQALSDIFNDSERFQNFLDSNQKEVDEAKQYISNISTHLENWLDKRNTLSVDAKIAATNKISCLSFFASPNYVNAKLGRVHTNSQRDPNGKDIMNEISDHMTNIIHITGFEQLEVDTGTTFNISLISILDKIILYSQLTPDTLSDSEEIGTIIDNLTNILRDGSYNDVIDKAQTLILRLGLYIRSGNGDNTATSKILDLSYEIRSKLVGVTEITEVIDIEES